MIGSIPGAKDGKNEIGPGVGPAFASKEKRQVRIFSLIERLRLLYAHRFNAR